MMYNFNVEVSIRKGLGPEWVSKFFDVGFDDVDNDVPIEEVKKWARNEVESQLRDSEDYRLYGENWVIVGVYDS